MSTRKEPLVTIIAPCYNGESYIDKFLESVLSQTYTNIELIVINDGSTDNTELILTQYEHIFSEKKIIYKHIFQINQGIGGAINNVLNFINGDYFTWIGTDDYFMPEYLEKLVCFLEENLDYALVRNDGYIVDEEDNSLILGKMTDNNFDKYNEFLFENAILEKNFNFGYSMVRTSCFDKVNPERNIYPSRHGQNWQILLPLFYYYKSAFYEEPLYYVISNTDSVSRNPKKNFDDAILQQNEYEKILYNVLINMDISDKEYWIQVIKEKYIHRKLIIGYQFKKKEFVNEQFELLKENNWVHTIDKRIFIRSNYILLDYLYKVFAQLKTIKNKYLNQKLRNGV